MLNKIILFLSETPAPEIDPDRVTPGLAGLLAFVLLLISVSVIFYFLNKSIKRTNKRFEEDN